MNRTLALAAAATLGLAAAAHASLPKNIILMIPDGASWGTWDGASYYQYGTRFAQRYDQFPVKLGMTTFPMNFSTTPTNDNLQRIGYDPAKAWDSTPDVDPSGPPSSWQWSASNPNGEHPGNDFFEGYDYIKRNYVDSAAAGTALASGIKTYNNAINYDNFGRPVPFLTQFAKAAGKSTGVVSSVPYSHATPAVFGAQNINRNNYHAITRQMIDEGTLDVIMGGGHPLYDDNGQLRATPQYSWISNADYTRLTNGTANGFSFIQTKAEFEALATAATVPSKVFGMAQVAATLQFNRSGTAMGNFNTNVPDLRTMSLGALNVLGRNANGFFVMIEGGAIDWANHANNTGRVIEETVDFNRAVDAVIDWVEANSNWNDTLLIVTTDHGNGMMMGPNSDTIPFQGVVNNGAGNLPSVRWHYGTHTNELVLFYAKGNGASLFFDLVDGVDSGFAQIVGFNDGRYIDNTDVFRVMAQQIPEPAALGLLAPLGLALLRRRAA
ncbi:MAG: alkaline phosphatase [Tepidisphaerales bacterium]